MEIQTCYLAKVKGYLISATCASKYSSSCPVENIRGGSKSLNASLKSSPSLDIANQSQLKSFCCKDQVKSCSLSSQVAT